MNQKIKTPSGEKRAAAISRFRSKRSLKLTPKYAFWGKQLTKSYSEAYKSPTNFHGQPRR